MYAAFVIDTSNIDVFYWSNTHKWELLRNSISNYSNFFYLAYTQKEIKEKIISFYQERLKMDKQDSWEHFLENRNKSYWVSPNTEIKIFDFSHFQKLKENNHLLK
jgi:uncharacterized protein with ATP-grasp and redox domains